VSSSAWLVTKTNSGLLRPSQAEPLACLFSILYNGIVPLGAGYAVKFLRREGHVIRGAALDLWILRGGPC